MQVGPQVELLEGVGEPPDIDGREGHTHQPRLVVIDRHAEAQCRRTRHPPHHVAAHGELRRGHDQAEIVAVAHLDGGGRPAAHALDHAVPVGKPQVGKVHRLPDDVAQEFVAQLPQVGAAHRGAAGHGFQHVAHAAHHGFLAGLGHLGHRGEFLAHGFGGQPPVFPVIDQGHQQRRQHRQRHQHQQQTAHPHAFVHGAPPGFCIRL